MKDMRYILIICCLLAGCSKQAEQCNAPLPHDVADAVALLISRNIDSPEVQDALHMIRTFDSSVVIEEETLENPTTGERASSVSHAFPKLSVRVDYYNGTFTGASRIETTKETSNQ